MTDNYTYLIINLCSLAVPLIFSFHNKIKFYQLWRSFLPAIFISAFVFIVWDIHFTNKGVWGFNNRYISGIYFLNLPVEEILFFLCIPYASLFTYYCFEKFKVLQCDLEHKYMLYLLSLIVLLFGLLNLNLLYTSVTFIFLSGVIAIITLFKHYYYFGNFITMFVVILIPFSIVNGLLTGSVIDEPVVWYNNNENLSVRFFTIPVEDVFYAMLLLLTNTSLFEYFRNRNAN